MQFKTLQTNATNSLSLKGLLLIAQFNFQRASECFHSKIYAQTSHFYSPSGEQKAECRLTTFRLGSSVSSFGTQRLSLPHRLSTLFFVSQSPPAVTRRTDKLSVEKLSARLLLFDYEVFLKLHQLCCPFHCVLRSEKIFHRRSSGSLALAQNLQPRGSATEISSRVSPVSKSLRW